MKHRILGACLSVATLLSATLIASTAATASTNAVKKGGSLNVAVVNTPWLNLDPAANLLGTTDVNMMNAIYGTLFSVAPGTLTVVPELATGWTFSNHNLTLDIHIRHGVKFQDGTPFTAQAVAASMQRDLQPSFACVCDAVFANVSAIGTKGKYDMILTLKQPFAPIIDAFIGSAPNWVVSPAALASEGAANFGQHPVGAGPFKVESNLASVTLVLQKYAGYWDKPKPYLNSLTFTYVANDQSAYAALQAGTVQSVVGLTTASIFKTAKGPFNAETAPAISTNDFIFNTLKPPFNDIRARQAVIYATNGNQVGNIVASGLFTVGESLEGPAGLDYQKTVPGYPKYNLSKAKALVQQIGGLSVNIITANDPTNEITADTLQNQWQQAGITVTVTPVPNSQKLPIFTTGAWQVFSGTAGNIDPVVGSSGLPSRFGSTGAFSGIRDSTLDGLFNQAGAYVSPVTRQRVLYKIWAYMASHAYVDITYASPLLVLFSKAYTGVVPSPAGTLSAQLTWDQISRK